ncbi:unnamed protein product [Gordionus sp. m RMFG-2023]
MKTILGNCSKDIVLSFAEKRLNLSSYIMILVYIVGALLLFIGVIGNSVIACIIRGLNSKTMHDFYLRHFLTFTALACSFDLVNSLEWFRYIFKHKYSLSKSWVIYISRYNRSLYWIFTQASGLTLCMLLLDRYVAILLPLKYRSYQNKKRLLKILPYIFLILVSIFCFGGDFWYDVIECYEESLNRTVYYRGKPRSFSRNKSRMIIDILNEILLSIVPTLIMLYLALRITLSLRRFLKRKRQVLTDHEILVTTRQNGVKSFYRLSRFSLRDDIKVNSRDHNNVDEPRISNINLDKRHSKLTFFSFSNNAGKPNINISSIIFFVLFFICYTPTSVTVFLRHYLVFRDKITLQRYVNNCAENKAIINSTTHSKEVKTSHSYLDMEYNNLPATFNMINGKSNLSINTSSLLNDKDTCVTNHFNTGKALESLYSSEMYLENLDNLYISLVFCVALITDKRILKKFKQGSRALLRSIKNIYFRGR